MSSAPGDERWVDFTVKVRDEPEQPVLIVAVRSPGGKDLEEASIAIWPIEGATEGAEPLRRAKTTRSGAGAPSARILGLPKGSYLITAGHREYAEGKGSLVDYKADPGEPAWKSIALGAGASVRARATDEKGAAVPGVELSVDRTGEQAVSIVQDEELAGKRAHRKRRTDAGGSVTIAGLDAGSYRVTAAPSGSGAQTHLVRLSDGKHPPAESLDLRIGADQQVDLEVRLIPAGHIRARLICSDRGSVPRSASLRILRFLSTAGARRPRTPTSAAWRCSPGTM